jgi:hypothetical protein
MDRTFKFYYSPCKNNIIVLTSKTGNKKRELPEKCNLRPLARLPIAWMASTATAMFTSVISCKQKQSVKLLYATLVVKNKQKD